MAHVRSCYRKKNLNTKESIANFDIFFLSVLPILFKRLCTWLYCWKLKWKVDQRTYIPHIVLFSSFGEHLKELWPIAGVTWDVVLVDRQLQKICILPYPPKRDRRTRARQMADTFSSAIVKRIYQIIASKLLHQEI